MQPPSFETLQLLKAEVVKESESWELYDEFLQACTKIFDLPWIDFRTSPHQLEDLCIEWTERLKKQKLDGVVRYMVTEVDKMKRWYPLIKYIKGDGYSSAHWADLFRFLGIKGVLKVDDLRVFHIAMTGDKLVERAKDVKELQSRAQAEV